MKRELWLDNIRWTGVLLVLFYHVFYLFNAVGVFGACGSFAEVQYQDAVGYLLYPWLMILLFAVAGVSSRHALQARSRREFLNARTRKLLVPSTIGLFAFQWILGYFNALASGALALDGVPGAVKYLIYALSGTGPLWFVQDLWLFSLLLLLLLLIDKKGLLDACCDRLPAWLLLLIVFVLVFGMAQFYADETASDFAGLINLYKVHYYFPAFLAGYFVLSRQDVQELLVQKSVWLAGASLIGLAAYTVVSFGENYTTPAHLAQPAVQAVAVLTMLAVFGTAKRFANRQNRLTAYLSRTSFGIYVVHYTVLIAAAWLLTNGFQFQSLTLSPVVIYIGCAVAVFLGSPLLYELLVRIPILRFCIFGTKGK